MNTFYEFEDIEDYLQGRMSDSDRAAFDAAVAADPQLAAQLEALRAEPEILRHLRREALLEKLDEWEKETPSQQKVVRFWYRRWPLAAAAAAIAMLLMWALWRSYQSRPSIPDIAVQPSLPDSGINVITSDTLKSGSPDVATESREKNATPSRTQPPVNSRYTALAVRNFNADYESINLMGETGGRTEQNPLNAAAEAIGRKQYENALAQLRKIPADGSDDYIAGQIMTGDIYFLQSKFILAEKAYSKPAQSEKDKFRDVAQWHLLLTYLAIYPQQSTDFERLMSAILGDADHPYLESAKNIQHQMQNQ